MTPEPDSAARFVEAADAAVGNAGAPALYSTLTPYGVLYFPIYIIPSGAWLSKALRC